MAVETSVGSTTEPRGAPVIVNVIEVLRCFTVDEPLLGVTEIAARVGLHKSSISRILATLETETSSNATSRPASTGWGWA